MAGSTVYGEEGIVSNTKRGLLHYGRSPIDGERWIFVGKRIYMTFGGNDSRCAFVFGRTHRFMVRFDWYGPKTEREISS